MEKAKVERQQPLLSETLKADYQAKNRMLQEENQRLKTNQQQKERINNNKNRKLEQDLGDLDRTKKSLENHN